MDALKQAINELLLALQRERTEEGDDPLLWVDRVFTIRGAGTVVTGTLLGGPLVVGTEIVAQPSGKRARIRGLQTQTQIVEKGTPHSRLAVNLSGIEKTDLKRGMYLALPNRRPSYSLLNASVQILPNAPAPLESEQLVKLYVGSLETLAQVRILGDSKLDPGKQGYVQLELESPAHFAFGDRFLLRHSELQDNLGGGQFIEEGIPVRGQKLRLVGPKRRQHLFPFEKPAGFLDLANLKKKSAADPETLSLLRAADRTFWTKAQWTEQGLKLHPNLAELGAYVLAPRQLSKLQDFLLATVQKYHKTNPLETGPSKETLRAATGVPARLFDQIIEKMPGLQEIKGAICSTDHQVTLSAEEERQLQDLLARIENTPYEPPNMATLLDWGFTRELVFAGAHLGHLAPLANEHWTSPKILDSVLEVIFQEECFRDGFELAAFRDRFATSRKFALTFLEQFDSRGVTIRKGDLRLLGKDPRS